jgi:hypothetical protein
MQPNELARWMRVKIWWVSHGGTVWGGTPESRLRLAGWVVKKEPQLSAEAAG